ncbi:MAG: hypothetical protein ACXABY_02195 [Candidatus Thorarchaeota archaeon]
MAKRKARFNSLSTPGVRQDLSNYLVELAFMRQNRGQKMPQKFWQWTKYKFRYRREIQACRKHIKKYGESAILHIDRNNYITTWTDYARIEFLAQARTEAVQRSAMPKDKTETPQELEVLGPDLRGQPLVRPRKKGLFEKIQEIENGKDS